MVSVFHSTGNFVTSTYPSAEIKGLSDYNHQIDTIGGFTSATVVFNCLPIDAEEWITAGVGRHVRSYSVYGNVVWEGIVNSISLSVGPRSITVGDYTGLVNRIKVTYTLRNPPAGTPDSERSLETDWAEDWKSSDKYGVLEEFASGGSGYSQEMEVLRDQILNDNLEPNISESIATGGNSGPISVTLSCVGYYRLFEKQMYTYGTTAEYDDLSVKVLDIIDANVNSNLFVTSKDVRNVGLQAILYEPNRRTAWGIITDDISKAANSGSDIICGMFANNTFTLDTISAWDIYSREGGSSVIRDVPGNIIAPSEVLPGRVMENNDLYTPIRYKIDSVKYSLSNNSVSINQTQRSIGTVLSQTMLGGMY